jgi:hypothetical protein
MPDSPSDQTQGNVVKFDGKPMVRIQQMQLRTSKRGEIAVSGIYAAAPLLFKEHGQVRGESFEQCQGMLAVKPIPLNDGRVRLEFVPEVHHGTPHQRWTSSEGVVQFETGRPREALTRLSQEVTLSPGDMFVIGSLPGQPGSVGDYFFTVETSTPPQNKVLFVRLSQTQNDDLFTAPDE